MAQGKGKWKRQPMSAQFTVKLHPGELERARRAARRQGYTLPGYVRLCIEALIRRHFPEAYSRSRGQRL